MPKYNTSIRICDLKEQIDAFAPTRIFINGEIVWDDNDLDVTELMGYYKVNHELWHEEFNSIVAACNENFDKVFERTELVENVIFKIVDYHHTEVYIETK